MKTKKNNCAAAKTAQTEHLNEINTGTSADTSSVRIVTQTLSAPYQADPLSLYQKLTVDSNQSLLLESAEISDKRALKSILVLDPLLKATCHGNKVVVKALQQQSNAALTHLADQLAANPKLHISMDKHTLTISCQTEVEPCDEMSRLLATTPLHVLRQIQQLPHDDHPFSLFLGGCFGFDLITVSEVLPDVAQGENHCPDFVFMLAGSLLVIDHQQQSCELIVNSIISADDKLAERQLKAQLRLAELQFHCQQHYPSTELNLDQDVSYSATVDISDQRFCQHVETLKQHIRAGDIFQVVPSRCFGLPCANPLLAYQALKQTNPSPYMFYLQDRDFSLFGASPESALKFASQSRQVELYPIAGTRPRGFTSSGEYCADLDGRIELELRCDVKENAEHLMLVDLARNDIARICEGGSRYVAELLKVDRYSHVMHLVSRVVGKLQPQLDALHAYQACMNMGTLSGAPKVMATTLIRQIEGKRRGSYGGAVGYLTGQGDMDTCIVIRSAFVSDNQAIVQAGAGVVYDSIASAEADETRQKARAVLHAIAIANANQGVRQGGLS
ncbi:anthranilate synthase component 1 [Thalassotalea ponticola]|uniref:anthranilate synthase component 1 n=1 Tax=Thalassotalea ponticola TaxID=1523392 RepID=UPI0025B4C84A|nr:anthranilate synthase component 1 [Thalassotalea ponticola]MDN3653200.1 anthranilate synthase component 1 [Thalassotalea ponticola]